MGLVNKVVPATELMATVMKTVETILTRAPIAVGSSKRSINQGWDMDVEAAQKNEANIFAELFNSDDVREGTTAFVEKRKAVFKGT
ncbi:2,3-dehydroadipyl-CoA hydratase [compost metagenome]